MPKQGLQPLSGGRKRANFDVHSESFSGAQISLPGDGWDDLHPAWRSELAGGGEEPEYPSPVWPMALVLSFLLTLGGLGAGMMKEEGVGAEVPGSMNGQVPRWP